MASSATVTRRAGLPLLLALGLLAGCGESNAPDDELQPVRSSEVPRVVAAQEALAQANIPTLDPHTMAAAEIREAIGDGPRCEFRYTGSGGPVLAVSMPGGDAAAGGVVKLNGDLVLLEPATGESTGPEGELLLHADPVRMAVSPDRTDEAEEQNGARRQEADMIFEIGNSLKVGYRGFLDCMSEPPMRPSRP